MFVPLGDNNPLTKIRFQYVTVALIIANAIAFALEMSSASDLAIADLAVVPDELFRAGFLGPIVPVTYSNVLAVPEPLTLITYMFLHGDVLHIVGNMLFLWVFGDNVEDAMGHGRFLIFYLLCGIAAAIFHSMMVPESNVPLVGASGAVAGVIGAYLLLHPRVGVWVLALNIIPIRITAALALGFWIASQFVMVMLPDMGPTAWWAHIGGAIAGMILVVFMRRPGVPLLDKA